MTVGENIKKYRKQMGLTQRELAERCGCAVGTIQQYELGKRQPRIEQLNSIASVLKVQFPDLIGGYETEPYEISPDHPIAFPGLEKKLSEIGYKICYGYDFPYYDSSSIWIDCLDGKIIPISLQELENLNGEVDLYLKVRIEALKKRQSKDQPAQNWAGYSAQN